MKIGASVGVALGHPGNRNMEGLMRQADIALYEAKAGGRSCFRVFEHKGDQRVRPLGPEADGLKPVNLDCDPVAAESRGADAVRVYPLRAAS